MLIPVITLRINQVNGCIKIEWKRIAIEATDAKAAKTLI
jgi:hypothetical protein